MQPILDLPVPVDLADELVETGLVRTEIGDRVTVSVRQRPFRPVQVDTERACG